MDEKIILGIIATSIGTLSYIPYFLNTLKKRTKPHAFSWLIWSIIQVIAFIALIYNGGGAGSWVIGFTAFLCMIVFFISLSLGEKSITTSDWICLILALTGIILWVVTKNPLTAVIFVSIADALGFIPTFRKAYQKPFEETAITYFFSFISLELSLLALNQFNVTTALFPIVSGFTNGLFFAYVIVRRAQIKRS